MSLHFHYSCLDVNASASIDGGLVFGLYMVGLRILKQLILGLSSDVLCCNLQFVLNLFVLVIANLNPKIKGFRAQLRGIQDLPFFMYRLRVLFG